MHRNSDIRGILIAILVTTSATAATWSPRAPLPGPRCAGGSGVAHVSGTIYLIGGPTNDAYNIAGDSWSSRTPNPRADGRTNLNSNGVLGNEVYFIGGSSVTGGFDVGSIDKYNAATDAWTLNVSSFIPNASAGSIGYGGSVYTFGGTFLGASSLAFRLTPPSASIFVLASVPTARVKPAVAEFGGKLWAIGGAGGSTAAEFFDPATGLWSVGPSLPVASPARAAGVVAGSLHVLLDAGVYRLSGGVWTNVAPPPPLVGSYAAIFVGDQLYAAGGCGTGVYTLTAGDTTPPVISAVTASPNVLSVPNHKMVPVSVAVLAADDTDPAPIAQIINVTSNEADDGLGDGDTPNDIAVTGPLSVNLRAERSGKGTGRIYTITVTVTDASGNSSSATTTVVVPRGK